MYEMMYEMMWNYLGVQYYVHIYIWSNLGAIDLEPLSSIGRDGKNAIFLVRHMHASDRILTPHRLDH